MANPEHLKILKQGVEVWNEWRKENPSVAPDLAEADLSKIDLAGVIFENVNLRGANLEYSNLSLRGKDDIFIPSNLRRADLSNANLFLSNLTLAFLEYANLEDANLEYTSLRSATLNHASFRGAYIGNVDFTHTRLKGADFAHARMRAATFGFTDLSDVRGLEAVAHFGPSYISVNTIYRSGNKIPTVFLEGCGLPDEFITYLPSLFNANQAIQFYSCFISYSTKDEEFARRLYSRMRDEHLRVWFAPEDVKSGEKLYEQIERAIQLHDRLLLVLSENSMRSEWVTTEIRRARKTEIEENRRKLFPITIVDFDRIKAWKCFDADSGKDLAAEVREYYIPDFSNWKDHDSFEAAFTRLLRDLRAEEKPAS